MTNPRPQLSRRSRRRIPAAVAAVASVLSGLVLAAVPSSATLPPPDPKDPAPATCSHLAEVNPSGYRGFGLPTAFYFHDGVLTDGPLKISNIQAAACVYFALPFTPATPDPNGYQPNGSVAPILGASAPPDQVNLTPPDDPPILTLNLPNTFPVLGNAEAGTAHFDLQGPITGVVRQNTDPRNPGTLDLDLWATFSGVANIGLLGLTPSLMSCPFLPVKASLSTTYTETAPGLAPTAPLSGPLGDVNADIALAPTKIQAGPCSGAGGLPLPIVGQQISSFLNQTLLSGLGNWSTPVTASVSLSAPATP